jgi:thiamine biosynthesis lipoprotein
MLSGMRTLGNRLAAGLSGAARRTPAGGWMSREEAIMGTAIRVELWSDDRGAGLAAIEAVMQEMHRIDASMSPFKPDSELSRVNRDAARAPVPVSAELFGLLARSLEFSERSGGAFDITFASAGHLYDYRRGVKPNDDDLAAARQSIGYRNLVLDPQAHTVRFARDGVRIDLGGFAKGYAADNGAAILRRHGIAHGIVTAGGDSHVLGDRRGRPWTVGIRDPRRPGEVVALLPLADVALSTSGDYERFFDDDDGVRNHHVIDPKTGKSPAGVRSATVIAPDGLTSEALSKCIFVMGVEKGLQFVRLQVGVDAVVVDDTGVLHYTPGLSDDRPRRPQ